MLLNWSHIIKENKKVIQVVPKATLRQKLILESGINSNKKIPITGVKIVKMRGLIKFIVLYKYFIV